MPQAHHSPELATTRPSGGDASGLVVDRHRALLWLGRREADALAAGRTSRDVEHIARGLIRRFGDEAIDRIPSAVGERASAFAAIDLHEWTLRMRGGGLAAFVLAAGGTRRVAAGAAPAVIDPGETVLIVPADAASIATRLASRSASEAIDAIRAGAAPGLAWSIHRPASQEQVA
jgi:hypothetical protein